MISKRTTDNFGRGKILGIFDALGLDSHTRFYLLRIVVILTVVGISQWAKGRRQDGSGA
jgi:hypothetical protein